VLVGIADYPQPRNLKLKVGCEMRRLIKTFAVLAVVIGGWAAPVLAQDLATVTPVGHAEKSERYQEDRRSVEKAFPRLREANFEVLLPASEKFNGVGSVVGLTGWVWPGSSIDDFDKFLAAFRYQRLSTLDYRLKPGMEKVVLYGKRENGEQKATHVAKQTSDGTWMSKPGKLALIQHEHPADLNGESYGKPIAVYVRPMK
jgi:hypothetical protein